MLSSFIPISAHDTRVFVCFVHVRGNNPHGAARHVRTAWELVVRVGVCL